MKKKKWKNWTTINKRQLENSCLLVDRFCFGIDASRLLQRSTGASLEIHKHARLTGKLTSLITFSPKNLLWNEFRNSGGVVTGNETLSYTSKWLNLGVRYANPVYIFMCTSFPHRLWLVPFASYQNLYSCQGFPFDTSWRRRFNF